MEQLSVSALLTFNFSQPVAIMDSTSCFLNKLVFSRRINAAYPSAGTVIPSFPGTCRYNRSSTLAIASMDPRDYSIFIQMNIFSNLESSNMGTVRGMEEEFLPQISIAPIFSIAVNAFIPHIGRPSLTRFDVDFENRIITLQFTDLMNVSSFRASDLTLGNPATSLALSPASTSSVIASDLTAISVSLRRSDLMALSTRLICTNRSDCFCWFPSTLAHNYAGSVVLEVSPTLPIQVRRFYSRV